jgi:hypothetical protein
VIREWQKLRSEYCSLHQTLRSSILETASGGKDFRKWNKLKTHPEFLV